jgi:hypothetical protein
MVVPVFFKVIHLPPGHSHLASGTPAAAIIATLVHTASYLAVAGAPAFVVFEQFGLGMLRKAWLNLRSSCEQPAH